MARRRAWAADERVEASRDDGERPYPYVYVCVGERERVCDHDDGVALERPIGGCGVAVSVSGAPEECAHRVL